jgi:hypothetical protein
MATTGLLLFCYLFLIVIYSAIERAVTIVPIAASRMARPYFLLWQPAAFSPLGALPIFFTYSRS